MKVAVAGGTGLVGRLVVTEARRAGHVPVVLARSEGIDLITGAGLDDALRECSAVIDVSNVTTGRRQAAEQFFQTATTHLLEAGARAGVTHHLTLSIVGVDRVGFGYYAGKRRQEEVLAAGPLPWTVLRATQFLEFAEQMIGRYRTPVLVVPRMLTRPVAATEVATMLVEALAAGPQGFAPELAGPQELLLADMMRQVLRRRGSRRPVVQVRLPGATGGALAHGGLLPAGEAVRGTRTFAEHVAGMSATASR